MKRFVLVLLMGGMTGGCELLQRNETPVCNPLGPQPRLTAIAFADATNCVEPDGKVVLDAVGGTAPYLYSIDGAYFQRQPEFGRLYAGDYKGVVQDASGCKAYHTFQIGAAGLVFSVKAVTTPDDKCFSDNGTIALTPRNGKRPFRYKLEDGDFGKDSVFTNLKAGGYRVTVEDAEGCRFFIQPEVKHGFTGVSYAKDIKPIIGTRCAFSGCHNGDNGFNINFLVFSNLRSYSPVILGMVSLKKMHYRQEPMSDQEIQFFSCWVEDGSPQN